MKNYSILFLFLFSIHFAIGQSPNTNSTLWFGYYQEDAANNPEDPMAGMIYLNIPNDGTFEGELFFSYAGCDGTFDSGRISGTVSDGSINGSWQGNVDGESVGGTYVGALNQAKNQYSGSYTNTNGKQGIECGEDNPVYYVAARGQWLLNGSYSESALELEVNTEADTDFTEFKWTGLDNAYLYRLIVIDQKCLQEKMNLEECMVWADETDWPDVEYGDGDLPAKVLVKGKSYVVNLYALDSNGVVVESDSKIFVYE